jgi:hypothetical protein
MIGYHRLVDRVRDWAPSSFIVTWSLATIQPIGRAIGQMMVAITESADWEEMDFARAQPVQPL